MSDDPHYQREKEKYENPVASREYLMSLLKEHDKPLSFLDICNLVNAFDEEARIGIQRRLRAMEREGQVQFTKQKKYILQNRDEINGKPLSFQNRDRINGKPSMLSKEEF